MAISIRKIILFILLSISPSIVAQDWYNYQGTCWIWNSLEEEQSWQIMVKLDHQGQCIWIYQSLSDESIAYIRNEEWYRAREDLIIIQDYMREFLPLKLDHTNNRMTARGLERGYFTPLSHQDFESTLDRISN